MAFVLQSRNYFGFLTCVNKCFKTIQIKSVVYNSNGCSCNCNTVTHSIKR